MKVLFAGPSLHREIELLKARYPEISFRPPAMRGDILRAVDEGASAIGLVDGYFGDSASVWPKEILFALDKSVAIAGGASMGALRAAECAAFGMIGIGSIFEDYRTGQLMDDEAVALVHGPEEMEWMPLSVPRVDCDATLEELERRGVVTPAEREKLRLLAGFMHYTNRTYRNIVDACSFWSQERRIAVLKAIAGCKIERKRADAHSVLAWLADVPLPETRRKDWVFAPTSQWEMLRSEMRQTENGHGQH